MRLNYNYRSLFVTFLPLLFMQAVLADNGRLAQMERISKRFVELTMAQRGEVKVVVTTVIVSLLKCFITCTMANLEFIVS